MHERPGTIDTAGFLRTYLCPQVNKRHISLLSRPNYELPSPLPIFSNSRNYGGIPVRQCGSHKILARPAPPLNSEWSRTIWRDYPLPLTQTRPDSFVSHRVRDSPDGFSQRSATKHGGRGVIPIMQVSRQTEWASEGSNIHRWYTTSSRSGNGDVIVL